MHRRAPLHLLHLPSCRSTSLVHQHPLRPRYLLNELLSQNPPPRLVLPEINLDLPMPPRRLVALFRLGFSLARLQARSVSGQVAPKLRLWYPWREGAVCLRKVLRRYYCSTVLLFQGAGYCQAQAGRHQFHLLCRHLHLRCRPLSHCRSSRRQRKHQFGHLLSLCPVIPSRSRVINHLLPGHLDHHYLFRFPPNRRHQSRRRRCSLPPDSSRFSQVGLQSCRLRRPQHNLRPQDLGDPVGKPKSEEARRSHLYLILQRWSSQQSLNL